MILIATPWPSGVTRSCSRISGVSTASVTSSAIAMSGWTS